MVGLPLVIAIAIAADPARLVAGNDASATLQISAPSSAAVSLWTSTGTISAPSGANGIWTAVYTPTAERFPRVALILVTVGSERAWLSMPIDGRDDLQLSTKPSSRVEVAIADRTFGPVRSDREGHARVPVIVPPGIRTAAVRVRDPYGNEKETSFDLRPPPFRRARMLASRDVVSWADPTPVTLEIFAVDATGRPARRADLVLSADRGEVGAAEERAPGLFLVPFRGPERLDAVEAHVIARTFGAKDFEQLAIALRPGPAARIELRPSAKTIAPGEVVHVEAAVTDARGNRLPDPVELAADFGAVTQSGPRAADYRASGAFAGRDFARLTAKAGSASAELPIALTAGAPAALRIEFGAREVREGEQIDATVQVADAGGNPVQGASLRVDALGATLLRTREIGHGRYAVSLRAMPASAPAAELRVGAGATQTSARLDVIEGDKPWGLSAGVWVLGAHNFSRAASAGVELEVASHTGLPWLEVFGRAQGLQFAPVTSSIDGAAQLNASLHGFGALAGARALLPLAAPWSLHASVAAGALRSIGTLTVQGGAADGTSQPTAQWSASISAGAGASVQLGPGRLLAEAQMAFVPTSGSVQGNLGGLWLRAGWLFNLR